MKFGFHKQPQLVYCDIGDQYGRILPRIQFAAYISIGIGSKYFVFPDDNQSL